MVSNVKPVRGVARVVKSVGLLNGGRIRRDDQNESMGIGSVGVTIPWGGWTFSSHSLSKGLPLAICQIPLWWKHKNSSIFLGGSQSLEPLLPFDTCILRLLRIFITSIHIKSDFFRTFNWWHAGQKPAMFFNCHGEIHLACEVPKSQLSLAGEQVEDEAETRGLGRGGPDWGLLKSGSSWNSHVRIGIWSVKWETRETIEHYLLIATGLILRWD